MKDEEAFDYGEYEKLYADPRAWKALTDIDKLAKKMKVKYALIGGGASFLHVKNPPEDYPDIDIIVYGEVSRAHDFIRSILEKKKYRARFVDVERDMVFAAVEYDGDIQIDIFTSIDESDPRTTKRINNVDVEPVEPLICEKLIRATPSDIRVALDLLAFSKYDRVLLSQIAREYRMTGMLNNAAYFARRLAAGVLSKSGVDNVVKRLSRG